MRHTSNTMGCTAKLVAVVGIALTLIFLHVRFAPSGASSSSNDAHERLAPSASLSATSSASAPTPSPHRIVKDTVARSAQQLKSYRKTSKKKRDVMRNNLLELFMTYLHPNRRRRPDRLLHWSQCCSGCRISHCKVSQPWLELHWRRSTTTFSSGCFEGLTSRKRLYELHLARQP